MTKCKLPFFYLQYVANWHITNYNAAQIHKQLEQDKCKHYATDRHINDNHNQRLH